jgi:(E)-4-hydroxy-3-methylbut-2-enyl-diphosphate synthase
MWKDRLSFADLPDAVPRIEGLARMGCGLLRFAVPDLEAAEVVGRLAQLVSMPLVADIHFDYKIALRCMDFPIAKIRINPGNIGSAEKVKAVLEKAAEKNIPIRIGVNAGSLPQDLRSQDLRTRIRENTIDTHLTTEYTEFHGEKCKDHLKTPCYSVTSVVKNLNLTNCAEALALAAERELAIFDEYGFTNVVVSMKASGIADTIQANRILAGKTTAPLHIGVTEAGPLIAGVARSSAALVPLLVDGIGDTLRVSLSDSMENEIIAAREILGAAAETAFLSGQAETAARLRHGGVKVISCPRCGRHGFDTHGFTSRWLPRLYALDITMSVAIMGCEVNGPEEARHADLGITGTGDRVLIFRRGKVVRTVCAAEADAAFAEELGKQGTICN